MKSMNLRMLLTAGRTLVLYAAAGYYLAQAFAAVQQATKRPAAPVRLRPPCPCSTRAAAGAHAAPEAEDAA